MIGQIYDIGPGNWTCGRWYEHSDNDLDWPTVLPDVVFPACAILTNLTRDEYRVVGVLENILCVHFYSPRAELWILEVSRH